MKITYRIFITIILLVLSTLTLSAEKKLYLWEVNSDSSTVYLMGSIHVGQKYIYPLDKQIEDAFERSDKLVLEIDIVNIDQQVMMDYMEYMILKDSVKLKDLISQESFDYLLYKISPFGVDSIVLNSFRPWYAYFTAEMLDMMGGGNEISFANDSLTIVPGIEQHFTAKAGNRELLYLETIGEQFEVLLQFDDRVDELIEHSIKTSTDNPIELTNLVAWWNNGNDEELLKQFKSEFAGMEEIMYEMFDNRNMKMADKIKGYLNSRGTYFVIVGAGHLIGNNSIVEILESQNNYRISRKIK